MQTSNNTILITGGGSGIGRGLAEAFLALDNKVIIAGRDQSKLDATVAAHPAIEAMTVDVNDPATIAAFAAELIGRHPALNVLINNAGVMSMEDLQSGELPDAELTVVTNLLGPMRMTAAFMPHLRQQDRAAVLNVTSGLAFVPMAATPTYCATKAALHSYTISLREQLRDTSVDVIEIVPPYVQTYLTGEHQANDPRAMPLDQYIAATMEILTGDPKVEEVIIERVEGLRYAEARGSFDEMLKLLGQLASDRG